MIATPLTTLLRKNSFVWTERAILAFNKLKQALSNSPVLRVPDFTKQFVVECDALREGLETVLMQERQSIAYLSQA